MNAPSTRLNLSAPLPTRLGAAACLRVGKIAQRKSKQFGPVEAILLTLLRPAKVALEKLRLCACCGRGSEKHGRARDENADGVGQLEGARRILLDQDDGQSLLAQALDHCKAQVHHLRHQAKG